MNSVSIVLYPMSYNKRGDESLHSVMGRLPNGRIVNVKLRAAESSHNYSNSSTIVEFAREDYKGRSICIAREHNCKENREGVLLFTDAVFDGTNSRGVDCYIAKWGVVLAKDSDSPDPYIGMGRIEIKTKTPKIKDLEEKKAILVRIDAAESEINEIDNQIADSTNFLYSYIQYLHEDTLLVDARDKTSIQDTISSSVNSNGINGINAGVMIRSVDDNGRVYDGRIIEEFSKYMSTRGRYESGAELGKRIADSCIPSDWLRESNHIEIMPLIRIHSSWGFSNIYGKAKSFKRLSNTYYDLGGDPVIKRTAITVSKSESPIDTKTLMFKTTTMSGDYGPPIRLSKDGTFSKIFTNEVSSRFATHITPESLIPLRIGISKNKYPTHRAIWLISKHPSKPDGSFGNMANSERRSINLPQSIKHNLSIRPTSSIVVDLKPTTAVNIKDIASGPHMDLKRSSEPTYSEGVNTPVISELIGYADTTKEPENHPDLPNNRLTITKDDQPTLVESQIQEITPQNDINSTLRMEFPENLILQIINKEREELVEVSDSNDINLDEKKTDADETPASTKASNNNGSIIAHGRTSHNKSQAKGKENNENKLTGMAAYLMRKK